MSPRTDSALSEEEHCEVLSSQAKPCWQEEQVPSEKCTWQLGRRLKESEEVNWQTGTSFWENCCGISGKESFLQARQAESEEEGREAQ